MSTTQQGTAKLPPRWFVKAFWKVHRALNSLTRGRGFLWTPASKRGWGAMRLTTLGRRSGQERPVIVGYLEDGDDLVVMAMNGWGAGEPAWWLNLQAHPAATVQLAHQPCTQRVVARAAEGAERDRLWAAWAAVDKDLDSYAAMRPTPTAVVVFSPA